MIKNIISIFLILTVTASKEEIQSFWTSSVDATYLSPLQLANKISESQPQTLKKVVLHYLRQEIEKMEDKEKMKGIMAEWFKKEGLEELRGRVERFMIGRLIDKLEIDSLSQKMKDEIQTNNESYLLTYEMYDLLID